ncbi:MAG: hypothetical protein ACOCXH_12135 [Cyclobacteriaceae bacterium]
MKSKITIFFIIMCIFSLAVNAQKIEKEKKIRRAKFPVKALEYLNRHFDKVDKVKFYRESTEDSTFFESKFTCQGDFYSVKFNPDGSLYDIEKLISVDNIPDTVLKKIKNRFDNDFKRWKIQKIQQRQFRGSIEFEIVVKGKLAKQIEVFEFHFSKSGDFLNKQKIESRFTDIVFF